MDIVSSYSFASCAWQSLQAVALILWPQAISSVLLRAEEYVQVTNGGGGVETYFARSLGFALLTLGLVTVVLTGSVPVGSAIDASENTISPYAAPVLLLTTLQHAASAFHCWARYSKTDKTGYFLGFVGSAVMAAFGTWCVLFGGEKGRISRRTGADKRTSGFPFRNAEADRRKAR